jgi:hypothetical protein
VLSAPFTAPPGPVVFLPGCPEWTKAIFPQPAAGNRGGRSEAVFQATVSRDSAGYIWEETRGAGDLFPAYSAAVAGSGSESMKPPDWRRHSLA